MLGFINAHNWGPHLVWFHMDRPKQGKQTAEIILQGTTCNQFFTRGVVYHKPQPTNVQSVLKDGCSPPSFWDASNFLCELKFIYVVHDKQVIQGKISEYITQFQNFQSVTQRFDSWPLCAGQKWRSGWVQMSKCPNVQTRNIPAEHQSSW